MDLNKFYHTPAAPLTAATAPNSSEVLGSDLATATNAQNRVTRRRLLRNLNAKAAGFHQVSELLRGRKMVLADGAANVAVAA